MEIAVPTVRRERRAGEREGLPRGLHGRLPYVRGVSGAPSGWMHSAPAGGSVLRRRVIDRGNRGILTDRNMFLRNENSG